MKVVLLAGGYGTRLYEETIIRPKPMVEIGGKPILWHIMKIYSHHGFNEFIICLGYKGNYIKEWFSHYSLASNDVTFDLKNNTVEFKNKRHEDWKVTLVDTGMDTMTGGRIKRIKDYIGDETFMMTYGDGVGNIDIKKLVNFHKRHKKIATVTAVTPEGRFGSIFAPGGKRVSSFGEKKDNRSKVSGGFFVFEPEIFDYLNDGDATVLEKEPLERLAKDKELNAYVHPDFWKPMDTMNDRNRLEEMWKKGDAPWKIWD